MARDPARAHQIRQLLEFLQSMRGRVYVAQRIATGWSANKIAQQMRYPNANQIMVAYYAMVSDRVGVDLKYLRIDTPEEQRFWAWHVMDDAERRTLIVAPGNSMPDLADVTAIEPEQKRLRTAAANWDVVRTEAGQLALARRLARNGSVDRLAESFGLHPRVLREALFSFLWRHLSAQDQAELEHVMSQAKMRRLLRIALRSIAKARSKTPT